MNTRGTPVWIALAAAAFLAAGAITVVLIGILDDDEPAGPEAKCAGALAIVDAPNDLRARDEDGNFTSTVVGQGSPDVLELAVRASGEGICVRWVSSVPLAAGTTLSFSATGPYIESAAFGYGFSVELSADGGSVVDNEGAPLDAELSRAGASITVFVPASEIVTDSPFPHERFSFRSSALSRDEKYSDPVPDPERPELGYDNARICAAPCGDLELDERRQPTLVTGAPDQSPSDIADVANEICRRASQELEELDRPQDPRETIRYARKAWQILSTASAELRAAEPPAHWNRYLHWQEGQWTKLQEMESIVPSDDFMLRTLAADVDELGRRAQIEARQLVVSECEDMGVPPLAPPLGGRPPGPPGG